MATIKKENNTIVIVLDGGHGFGKAFNRGGVLFNEGDQMFKYSLIQKKALEQYENVKVLLTRKTIRENPSLESRGKMYKGDLFISLHTNAFSNPNVSGTETFVSVRNSDTLAKKINDTIVRTLGTKNRGVKRRKQSNGKDWYGVLRNSVSDYSILIEHVFHTNRNDSKKFLDNQEKLAEEVAKTIANHYGLKRKDSTVKSDKYYRVFAGSFKNRHNADELLKELKNKGFKNSFISYEEVKK